MKWLSKASLVILVMMALLFTSNNCKAQTTTDSLLTIWNDDSQSDLDRLNAVQTVNSEIFFPSNPDSCRFYCQAQYDFAKRTGHKYFMADAKRIEGITYAMHGEFDMAKSLIDSSMAIDQSINNYKGLANSLNVSANIESILGNQNKALEKYLILTDYYEKQNDSIAYAKIALNAGHVYLSLDEYELAAATT